MAAEKNQQDSAEFRDFRRQLFHASLMKILSPLKPWVSTPQIMQCGDGHYRCVIYGIGPYIADYPEQTLLACVVSGWCPRYVLQYNFFREIMDVIFQRCTALATNLDGDLEAVQRSHEHTNAVSDAVDGNLKLMWEGYGLIGKINVN